jgi:peptidoglycan/LPS O-acetylase OafA/YrhL
MRATLIGCALLIAVATQQGMTGVVLLMPVIAAVAIALVAIRHCEAPTREPVRRGRATALHLPPR